MAFIKTGAIALALIASFGALATSASAQTSRADRIAAAREARAEAQGTYRTYPRFAPAYAVPSIGTEPANPSECRTDDGYGRFATCDQ